MAWNTPTTWVPNTVLTAGQLNAQVRDNFNAIGDPWTAYTPAWTAAVTDPTLGNGTLIGNYMQAGKLVHFRLSLTTGSTTTYGSGTYGFSLPVPAAAPSTSPLVGTGFCQDTSAGSRYLRFLLLASSTTVWLTSDAATNVATNVPFTWANTDILHVAGSYEAA